MRVEQMLVREAFMPDRYRRGMLNLIDNALCWQWHENVVYGRGDDGDIWSKQLCAGLIGDDKADHENPRAYDFFYPLIYMAEDAFGINIESVVRMKVNQSFTVPFGVNPKAWHVDAPHPNHKSIVIHMDESDGETVISSQRYTGRTDVPIDFAGLVDGAETRAIEFMPGRALMFDSNLIHYGSMPKRHKRRTVVNLLARVS